MGFGFGGGGVGLSKIKTLLQPHKSYFFHGCAGQQILGDPFFYDIAANNNGVFGANLSNAQAWLNTGYVSTNDPVGGATDSVIRLPNLNFDYSGGEKLIVWWLGAATPEGTDATLMGDAFNSSTPGVRVRMKTTGKFDLVLYGAGAISLFGGATSTTVFDGSLHSFAFVLDGAAKKYGMWVDETYEPVFGGVYSSFASGQAADTKNSVTWNIGSGSAAPGGTEGSASKTRAFVIMRLSSSDPTPTVAQMTNLFKQLRANPFKVIAEGTF